MASLCAILYLYLAARTNPWCWWWAIASSLCWAYASYALYDLYIDALLQLFYVGMGVSGLVKWKFGAPAGPGQGISRMSVPEHIWLIVLCAAAGGLGGYLFDRYTDTQAPFLNAFTSAFSIGITGLVVRKKLENWLYWLVVDAVYVYLYASRGGYVLAGLFVLYLILATVGFFQWRKQWRLKKLGKTI